MLPRFAARLFIIFCGADDALIKALSAKADAEDRAKIEAFDHRGDARKKAPRSTSDASAIIGPSDECLSLRRAPDGRLAGRNLEGCRTADGWDRGRPQRC